MWQQRVKRVSIASVKVLGIGLILLFSAPLAYPHLQAHAWIGPVFKGVFILACWLFAGRYLKSKLGRKLTPAEQSRFRKRRQCFLICALIILLIPLLE